MPGFCHIWLSCPSERLCQSALQWVRYEWVEGSFCCSVLPPGCQMPAACRIQRQVERIHKCDLDARTNRGTSVSKKKFQGSQFLWHWLHLTGLPFSSYFLQVPELFVLFDPEFPEILDPDLFPGGKPRNWMPTPHVEKEKAATFTCCLLPACWVWHWPAGWSSLIHGQDWYIKQAGNDKMQAGSNLIISLTAPSGLVISAPQQSSDTYHSFSHHLWIF